jgi:hypothetical protein
MGRSGSALALLLPNESSYVEFLRLRKVPLVEAQPLQGKEGLTFFGLFSVHLSLSMCVDIRGVYPFVHVWVYTCGLAGCR